MKRLDRLILKSFVGPFFAILLVVIFILMLQLLWLYVDELVGKGLGLRIILEFMFWGGCTSLPLALPLATLLSSVMTMGSLSENNELMAMKAAGISVRRVMLPIMLASLVISVGAFFAGNDLVPKANNEIYTLRADILKTKKEIKIPSGIFYDGIEGYILRVDGQNKETGMFYGMMVYDHNSSQGNTSVTMADSALITISKEKDFLIFTLFNGTNYKEDNLRNYSDTSMKLQRIDFDRQELRVQLDNYAFEKSDSVQFSDQAKTMPVKELRYHADSLQALADKSKKSQLEYLQKGLFFQFSDQLDTTKHYDYSAPVFKADNFLKASNLEEERNMYARAHDIMGHYVSSLMTYRQSTYEYYFYLRRCLVELLKKLAQALACFILFFIGAPLGALVRRGKMGTMFIVAVLFFVLYWVVDISGIKLATDGAINAYIGVFISAQVLFPIGIYMTSRAVHDADIFNTDSMKNWWRKLKSRIAGLFHKPRIVYMGTPEFAVAPLDNLVRKDYKVVGVVTVADKPSGRGLKVNMSAVKQYAEAHGIPVLQPLKLKDPEFLEALAAWKADLFVVVAFRMLPEEVWRMPKLGTFNLHAALLPQYRGAAPINWAVINGEHITGVTTFMIDKDIDTGGIMLRQESRIGPDDTAGDVHDRLMELGTALVEDTVEGLIQHNLELRVQRSFIQGSEVLKKAPKLTRELCHIDWDDTTASVYNLIRGLSPYPAAYTELVPASAGEDVPPVALKIYGAAKMEGVSAAPGTVLSDGKTWLAIATSDGAISLTDIQMAGKKRMDVKSFLLGFREPESYICTKGTSKAEMAKARE